MAAVPKESKQKLSTFEKKEHRDEYATYNHIEERIDNFIYALSLNLIIPKLQETSEILIATTQFVLNLYAFRRP